MLRRLRGLNRVVSCMASRRVPALTSCRLEVPNACSLVLPRPQALTQRRLAIRAPESRCQLPTDLDAGDHQRRAVHGQAATPQSDAPSYPKPRETHVALDDAKKQLTEAKKALTKAEARLTKAETKLGEAKMQLGEAKKQLGEAEKKLGEAKEARDMVEAVWIEENQPESGPLHRNLQEAQRAVDTAQKGVDTAQKGVDTAQKGVDTAQKGVDTAQDHVTTCTKAVDALMSLNTAPALSAEELPIFERTCTWFDSMVSAPLVELGQDQELTKELISQTTQQILWKKISLPNEDADDASFTELPKTLHVLRFPAPIKLEGLWSFDEDANLLFVRQDDLDLFKAIRSHQDCVLTGNPGVSKSWFQVRFLLFCARPDIYKAISGEAELPPDFKGDRNPPEYIFRMVAGENRGCVFDLVNKRVLPASRGRLADNNKSTVLYEPAKNEGGPPNDTFPDAQFIMTASPLISRYKEFEKNFRKTGEILIMPCHFATELVAMGRLVNHLEDGRALNRVEDDEDCEVAIRKRLRRFGPFVRYVLYGVKEASLVLNQANAFQNLDPEAMLAVQRTIETGHRAPVLGCVSHWLLKYQVPRDAEGRVTTFRRPASWLEASTESVTNKLLDKLTSWKEDELVAVVLPFVQLNNVEKATPEAGTAYQQLVERWLLRRVSFMGFAFWPGEDQTKAAQRGWILLQPPEFGSISRPGAVNFTDMEMNVLYSRRNWQSPFVDMMWVEERNGKKELFAIQVTLAETHPKALSTFRKNWLKEILGINDLNHPDTPKINLIFVLQPRFANKKRSAAVAAGFAWKGSKSTAVTTALARWREAKVRGEPKVEFFIVKPVPKEGWGAYADLVDNEGWSASS